MNLKSIVTTTNVAKALNKLPDIKTKVMDDIYPTRVRDTHPSALIKISEITELVKAVPVVRRGAQSVTIGGGDHSNTYIEAQPVIVNYPIPAHTLNDLKIQDSNAHQNWLKGRVAFVRNTVRATSEALCAQSLTGKINFAMKTDSAEMDLYQIDFGTVPALACAKKFDGPTTTLMDILSHLQNMAETIERNGGGSVTSFKAASDVWAVISMKIIALSNETRISAKVDSSTLTLGGYMIERYAGKYFDPKSKTYKAVIAPKTLKAIGTDGGWAFRYLAIDDVDAGLQALPLFLKSLKVEDPNGWKIMGQSKPLPIPDVNAICDSEVLV